MQILLLILVVGMIGWLLYKEFAIAGEVEEKMKEDPNLSKDEAEALLAKEKADVALLAAQQAEADARIDEQARKVAEDEANLAALQAAAIAKATEETKRAAEEAEVQARIDRIELERRWTQALDTAETSMLTAKSAAITTTTTYLTQQEKVTIWLKRIVIQKASVEYFQTRFDTAPWYTPIWDKNKMEADLTNARTILSSLQTRSVAEVNKAANLRSTAVATIAKADSCIERVLTIIADIRLLGILLSLANRVDSIAQATRNKLTELEEKIRKASTLI